MRTSLFITLLAIGCGDISAKDQDTSPNPSPTDSGGSSSTEETGTPADTSSPDEETGAVDTGAHDTGSTDTGEPAPEPDTADLDGDGYSVADGDCNDLDSNRHPGRSEICDGVDNNCNDEVDEGVVPTWYLDYDSDGHGTPEFTYEGCEALEGYVATSGDCDDSSSLVFPGGIEICDERDNNCNGTTDEDVTSTFYVDLDDDGYGDAGFTLEACSAPSGYVDNALDCNDFDMSMSPDGTEFCDGFDNDCDGETDGSDAFDAGTYFRDADEDTYGTPEESIRSCMVPAGFVANSLDCDDHDNDIYPDAEELCDGEDNDCDTLVDEEGSTVYADLDGDGYGDPGTELVTCDTPFGYTVIGGDCDDSDADVNPLADEVCDAVDNDCDGDTDEADALGASTFYADADGDGFGDEDDALVACSAPEGFTSEAGDCDDGDAGISPGVEEISADGIDQDCDGEDLVIPTHTGSEPGWYHANYFGEYTTFNPSTYYGSGSISCPDTCAHYGLTARGARFVCNQYTGGSGEGCYPYNDGMYGEANCGLMVRDMVLLTENGNTEDCAGGIMGCVTGSCTEGVTWHSVECQCE